MDGKSKNARTLDMYVRLCEGKTVNKTEESRKFGVDQRSIQRDNDDIRAFLDERSMSSGDGRTIEYDRTKKGFIMAGAEPSMMTNSEILAVAKILLESRAFTKRELKMILDKLVEGCVPLKNMKLVWTYVNTLDTKSLTFCVQCIDIGPCIEHLLRNLQIFIVCY